MRTWVWLIGCGVCLAVSMARGQDDPASLLAGGGLRDATAGALRQLLDPASSPPDRRSAAMRLLGDRHDDAQRTVAAALGQAASEAVWRAMAQAIALHPDKPRDDWWPALLNRYMLATTEPDVALLADALGRFDDGALRRRVRQTSEDAVEPAEVRVRTIRLWGLFRDKETVERLLKLTDGSQPQPVRAAAFAALASATGLEQFNDDPAAWSSWWAEARGLGGEAWLTHILSNLSRREAAMRLRMEEGEQRLLVSQEALYRASSAADRPGVLAYMLGDTLAPIRQLGLDLCLQRLLDNQPFEESLRVALRERLVDESPAIRSRASLLLRDLLDEPAARIAAERLSNQEEHVLEVMRSYLLLIARLPQAAVVGPALALLEDTALRPEAAGALASASDAGLLGDAQRDEARKLARRGLPPRGEPAPPVVTLLGKVGDEEDFARIAGWIDSPSVPVKQASAAAWAGSTRSLRMLAERAGDPVIRPIVTSAAEQRGDDAATLRALAQQRPGQADAVDAWRRALAAMAARVGGPDVLWVVEHLESQGEPPATLEQLLTAAIAATGHGEQARPPVLLLKRAEVRLAAQNPTPALADFDQLSDALEQLNHDDRDRWRRGRIRALLETGSHDAAFEEAGRLLGAPGGASSASDDRVTDQFLDAARKLNSQGKPELGRDVLMQLRRLLGPSMKPELAQRITLLESELRRGPPEADGRQ